MLYALRPTVCAREGVMGLRALAFGVMIATVNTGRAQETTCRFRWVQGQTLTYRAESVIDIENRLADHCLVSKTKISQTRRWQVLAVDGAGIATVRLTLTALRMEVPTPSGEVLLFDSTEPDRSTPQLREQLSKYVGAPLATLRLDSLGRVIEVKESKLVPASYFEKELPFIVILPGSDIRAKQFWSRDYSITQEPPDGTGEKYDALQRYTCLKSDAATATIGVTTSLKTKPAALADQAPLLPFQTEGEVVFDVKNGRMQSVNLKVKKELEGHQGAGTRYKIERTYTEQLLDK